ncbi:MAG: GGDEF domain-containing protein [Lachnotalea sp.]
MRNLNNKSDWLKYLYLTCITMGLVFLIFIYNSYRIQNPAESFDTKEYGGWSSMSENVSENRDNLEEITIQNGEINIYNVLPDILENSALLFRTENQTVEVFVDGQVIYQYGKNIKMPFGKSVGSAYHIVNLDSAYEGKTIAIKLKCPYESKMKKQIDFHIGTSESLITIAVAENLSSLLINLLLFMIGLACLFISLIFYGKIKTNQTLYIGIFALLFSIWSIFQSCVLQLFIHHNIMFMYIGNIFFLLIPIAVILYIRELFQAYDDKGLKILNICFCLNFIICIILQMMGIRDIKEMFPIIHTMILIGMLYILFVINKKYVIFSNCLSRRTIRLTYAVFFVLIVIDIFRYYCVSTGDRSKYARFGVLVLAFYMLLNYAKEYIVKSKAYTEASLMAKLAYRDVMTGLYNRTAYAEDTADYEKQLYLDPEGLNLIYVILDLNDLKVLNDFHGHGVGDHFIVTTGKIIKKAFEKLGKCYRIGGDEFAVILKDKSLGEFYKAIIELNKLIMKENEIVNVEYSLAYGYALFEAGKYSSLKELIDKADKNMYENKNIYKENKMSIADVTT